MDRQLCETLAVETLELLESLEEKKLAQEGGKKRIKDDKAKKKVTPSPSPPTTPHFIHESNNTVAPHTHTHTFFSSCCRVLCCVCVCVIVIVMFVFL